MQAMSKEVVADLVAGGLSQPMSAVGAVSLWLGFSVLGWGTVAAVVAALV